MSLYVVIAYVYGMKCTRLPVYCLVLLGCLLSATQPVIAQSVDLFRQLGTRQLVVVKTANFETNQGQLLYYELDPATNRWLQKLPTFAVTVGQKGLAWGAGLHQPTGLGSPRKREGDGKSPAGIFRIGTAFGSRPVKAVGGLKVPYLQADKNTFCVDDPASAQYNQLVSTDTLKANWNSAERMLIPDYDYGFVVEYNYPKARPGDGSCIFIHLWRNSETGTAGCTAMSESNLLQLFRLLDGGKKPLLVQMPGSEYEKARRMYGLP